MKWISVKDRLPKLQQRVLVLSNEDIYIAHIDNHLKKNELWWDISESGRTLTIIQGRVVGLNEYEKRRVDKTIGRIG